MANNQTDKSRADMHIGVKWTLVYKMIFRGLNKQAGKIDGWYEWKLVNLKVLEKQINELTVALHLCA